MFVRRIGALLLAVTVLGLTGCSAAEKALAPLGMQTASAEMTAAAVGAPLDGELASGGASRDIPVWPGARVVSSEVSDGASIISLEATDAFDAVLVGVEKGFQDEKWQVAEDSSGDEGSRVSVLTVSRSDLEGVVTLTERDGVTSIDYLVAPVQ